MVKKVLICKDTQESIFTAIYEAYELGMCHDNISVVMEGDFEYDLFSDYIEIHENADKAGRVINTLKTKFSEQIQINIFNALLSCESDKADVVYHFIVKLLKYGGDVLYNIGDEVVSRIFDFNRNVSREAHHFLGFLRFEEAKDGILYAVYNPKNKITMIVAEHFADRLNTERFVIIDTVHNDVAFYTPETGVYMGTIAEEDIDTVLNKKSEDRFESMWKVFFEHISIKERENKQLQCNNIPLRFRTYMPEFESDRKLAR